MGTITVSNLGKAYKTYPTRLSRLAEWILPFLRDRALTLKRMPPPSRYGDWADVVKPGA